MNSTSSSCIAPTGQGIESLDSLTQTALPADTARRSAYARPGAVTERFYYPELDSIRFFLFCAVWSFHALPKEESVYAMYQVPAALAGLIIGIIKAGMCSLDAFFVLSAFLITELLLRERELRGSADLKAFYIRRLLRIWPLYFFVLALACLFSVFNRSQFLGWDYGVAYLLFMGNWIDIFRGFPRARIIAPMWTVSFEEQFYLLWPLVLVRASKRTIYRIAIGLLVVANFVRFILLFKHQGGQPIWWNTFARLDTIAFGILLAMVLHRRTLRLALSNRLGLLLVGIALWVFVGNYCGLLDPFPTIARGMIGYPLMSLGCVAIFLSLLGAPQDGVRFLKNPKLVYLGKISYGLYAYHILSLQLSDRFFGRYHPSHGQWTLTLVCGLLITFVLAGASFKWLESPFLRLKRERFTYVPSGSPVLT